MAIEFPCLEKDMSFWIPQGNENVGNKRSKDDIQDVAHSLGKYLKLSEEPIRPEETHRMMDSLSELSKNLKISLDGDSKCLSSKMEAFHIMSPVLKKTSQSFWLAKNNEQAEDPANNTREPNLTTSLWLATSSSEPFTCVTRTTNEAAAIQLPDIMLENSPKTWLSGKVERQDVEEYDRWLTGQKEVGYSKMIDLFYKWEWITATDASGPRDPGHVTMSGSKSAPVDLFGNWNYQNGNINKGTEKREGGHDETSSIFRSWSKVADTQHWTEDKSWQSERSPVKKSDPEDSDLSFLTKERKSDQYVENWLKFCPDPEGKKGLDETSEYETLDDGSSSITVLATDEDDFEVLYKPKIGKDPMSFWLS